jgi:hypothetical protein
MVPDPNRRCSASHQLDADIRGSGYSQHVAETGGDEIEMMQKSTMFLILAGILGAAAGFAYYHFIGCASGTCPITSNPYISTGYGAVLGLVLASGRKKPEKG